MGFTQALQVKHEFVETFSACVYVVESKLLDYNWTHV